MGMVVVAFLTARAAGVVTTIRSRCNEHKVRGQQVYYNSVDKYVSDDVLDLLFFSRWICLQTFIST
jgi:SLT domain-containing protein